MTRTPVVSPINQIVYGALDCLRLRMQEVGVMADSSPWDLSAKAHKAALRLEQSCLLGSVNQIIQDHIVPWVAEIILTAKFGRHPLLPSRVRFSDFHAAGNFSKWSGYGVTIIGELDAITGDVFLRADFQVVADA